MSDNAKVNLAAGRYIARDKAPYLRAILLGFAPIDAPGLGTIGVTKHGVLMVDWAFIDQCTADEVAGLLVHEALHICLKHADRAERGALDQRIANQAADLAINPSIWDMGLQLPGGKAGEKRDHPLHGMYPEDYGWERGLSQEEYYDLLRKQEAQQPKGGGGQGQGKITSGHCGSCGGNPLPDEPDDKAKESRSENEMHRMRRQVAEAVREFEKSLGGRGTVPGFMKRWADKLLQPPEVPWNQELAVCTRAAVAWRENAVDHRYDAPSRRQAGIGYGPGKPILPRFRMPVPNISVVLDTSGSMGTQELTEAGREVNGILKAIGAQITFCTCDADVTGVTKVRTLDEALGRLSGGGGTNMAPAFEAVCKTRPAPDVIICITDLCIGDPGPAPRGSKVIWVAVGHYASMAPDPPWGKTIRTTSARAAKPAQAQSDSGGDDDDY